jgi:hypothetical protein
MILEEPVPPRSRSGFMAHRGTALLSVAAALCLVIAVAAGTVAHAALARKPTAAQRSAASAAAVASRWRTWPAGQIFPASLSYRTALLTTETAGRIGISANPRCGAALDASLVTLATREHCQAALRADYLDQLQGVVYTVGVLAFPDAHLAAAFAARLPVASGRAVPLQALALPGTAGARFGAAARQGATERQDGPFVVLTASGYADGQPAGSGQEPDPAVFAPGAQLAAEVGHPLADPVTVNCHSPEWSC